MQPLRGTETILVVDDDNIVLRLAKSMLTLYGYTVITAASGKEALHLFAIEPEIKVELVDRIWKLRPGLPALYCSGYSGKEFLFPEIARNVQYLAKPFTSFQLTKRIREVLEKSSGGSATSMRSGAART